MKKLFTATTLALVTMTAAALDVKVSASRQFGDIERNSAGVTVSKTVGPLSLGVGFNRSAVGANDQNRYGIIGGYTVTRLGPVAVTPTVGVAYLQNKASSNGMAMTAGLELSMPVYKNVDAVFDYSYQKGQSRVSLSDGNSLALGLRVSF